MKYVIYLVLILTFTSCNSTESSSEDVVVTSAQSSLNTKLQEPLLVIRVEYDNQLFVNDADVWAQKMFGSEAHQLNDYFKEVSQNRFSFTPVKESDESFSSKRDDGIVTVHLHKDHPNSGSSTTIHSDLKLALEEAGEYVDFKSYDKDNSNTLSIDELTLIFIIAGAEEAYAPADHYNSVWAHESCVSSVSINVDGISLADCESGGNYALFGERHIDEVIPEHDATIGIIAHELGHALFTLPDLYPTSGAVSSSGIGYFGLMGGGLWAYQSYDEGESAPGNTPSHFCAWSKLSNAWIEPKLLTTSKELTLASTSQDEYSIVKIALDDDEYLLLENRAADGYDAGLYAIEGSYVGGIALWHINESIISEKLESNSVQNDEDAKGVDLVEARLQNIDTSQMARGNARNLFYRENIVSAQLTEKLSLESISSPSNSMTLKVVQ